MYAERLWQSGLSEVYDFGFGEVLLIEGKDGI
jgi:hypothetical protein